MQTIAVAVAIIGLLTTAGAAILLLRLRAEVSRLRARTDRVARRVEALPSDLSRAFGNRDRHIISVELLNLFELAQRQSWVARPLSVLTPRLLTDLIHRAVVTRVRDHLATAGVEADVRLHRIR